MVQDVRASRYHRQLLYNAIGEAGQDKLGAARVGLVGCGALGSVVASHLVRAGVGYLRIVDRDYIELHNLARQMLFTESDVERRLPKAAAAADHLRAANSEVIVEPVVADLNAFSVIDFADGLDVLVDGTDNFATRFLINDVAVSRGLPWVYGGVIGASGMSMTIVPGEGPCLRCLLPELPAPGAAPTCDTAGVLNTAVAVVASVQATEVYKLLIDPTARGRGLFTVDLWETRFESFDIERDPDCPTCGRRSFTFLESDDEYAAVTLCGRDAVQVTPRSRADLDLEALRARLAAVGETRANAFLVEVSVEGKTITVFPDGRAIIKGVDDAAAARVLYSRYVGQ